VVSKRIRDSLSTPKRDSVKLYSTITRLHAMGTYEFTCATTGEISDVEYTFGYKRNPDGKVRICLHHSSIPYESGSPAKEAKPYVVKQKIVVDPAQSDPEANERYSSINNSKP
jgi:hypothetical protein